MAANQREAMLVMASGEKTAPLVPGGQKSRPLFEDYLGRARAALQNRDTVAARQMLSWFGLSENSLSQAQSIATEANRKMIEAIRMVACVTHRRLRRQQRL